jgi:hypothetical protein
MADLTSLIQQALDNGDTATARVLSRALENETKIYTPQPTQTYTQPEYYQEASVSSYESVREISVTKILSSWQLAVIMLYIAIAEVSAPGHQGLMKAHEMHWFWGPRFIAGLVGVKLPEFSTDTSEPQVGEVEVTQKGTTSTLQPGPNTIIADRQLQVECNGDAATFSMDAIAFTLRNIRDCQSGTINKDSAFATITDDTFGTVNDGENLKNFTVEDLRTAGLLR